MSYDLIAYFRSKPGNLPGSSTGPGWALNVNEALRLAPADLSAGLLATIGRCSWQVEINREGADCPEANAALNSAADMLRASGAAIFDPQREEVRLGNDMLPVPQLEIGDDVDSGFTLHCFFERADQVDRDLMRRLLEFLEQNLPAALPHRYGNFEPPPYRWEEGGAEAFIERWDRADAPFWIGKTPAAETFETFDYQLGRSKRMFRAGHLAFSFRSRLSTDPGCLLGVLKLAEWLAVNFDAFYTALVPGREIHGPFWKGMIPGQHLMLILGPPLLGRWKLFDETAISLGGRHHQLGSSSGGTTSIRPPADLCYQQADTAVPPTAPTLERQVGYAPSFPFERDIDPYQPE